MSNKTKRTAVPKLRFPDFRNARGWIEKLFNELLDDILDFRGRTPKKIGMEWGEGSIVSLSANNVKNGYIDFDAECNLGSESLYDQWMRKVNLEKGDIVFTMEAPLGNALLVPDSEKYILSQRVVAFKTKKTIKNSFLVQLLWSDVFQKKLEEQSTGSTAKGISQKSLRKIPVWVPINLQEQQKIADCLCSIDKLITTEQQKLETLQDHKKGLMQQLFPAEGATLPKLRFPDFRDANGWEIKKIDDISKEILDGDWIESKDQSDNGIRLIQTGNIGIGIFIPKKDSEKFISKKTFETLKCKEVFPGDCLISRLPDPPGRSIIVPDIGQRMVTAVDCTIIRFRPSSVIPYMFLLYSQTEQYFSKIHSMSSGSTRKRISRTNLSAIEIPLPQLKEQQKIAAFLSNLDDLITAQSQKLEALQDHKKGLMQQLFPSVDEAIE